jgi:hypothetical protein
MVSNIYLIDGLSDPPKEWEQMKLNIRRAFPDIRQHIASHENVGTQSWAWTVDYGAVVIGHSLGAYAAANVSVFMKTHSLIGIDPVRPLWFGGNIRHQAARAFSLRRSKWFGPRTCDLAIANLQIVPNSNHNSIITLATPQVIRRILDVV